ncbi:hypothetical protein D3C75_1203270 [compost metagenome]
MLAQQGFALGLQLVEFGMPGGDFRILPGAGKQRQVETDLHTDHVAELATATLVVEAPAPVGLLLRQRLAHLGLRFARHRLEDGQRRVAG